MLVSQPLFTGQNKLFFEELESTNDTAMDVLSKTNPSEGTCIITDYQTAGRGQIGRKWYSSPKKNILISYIFYPKWLEIKDQFYLNIISSLAVRSLLSEYTTNVKVKWPNDIYINDEKIAGILVQNNLRNNKINGTVIGIGININEDSFPVDIPNPSSLKIKTEKEYDRGIIIDKLSIYLEQYYLMLSNSKYDKVKNEYINALYRLGETHFFKTSNEIFEAKIKNIASDGKLILENKIGRIESYDTKDIVFII